MRYLALILILSLPAEAATVRVRMLVTAYCPCRACTIRATGITASGRPARGRFCAAPRQYKFGTRMTIPGYGTVPVLDRGGAIRGRRLDVYFPTHRQARKWGRKWLWVVVRK